MVFIPPPPVTWEDSHYAAERNLEQQTGAVTMGGGTGLGSWNNPLNYKGGSGGAWDPGGQGSVEPGGAYKEYGTPNLMQAGQYAGTPSQNFLTGYSPPTIPGASGGPSVGDHSLIGRSRVGAIGAPESNAQRFSQWLSTPGNNWWQTQGAGPNLPGRVAGTRAGEWSTPPDRAAAGSAGPGRTVAANQVNKSFTFGLEGGGKNGIAFSAAAPQQQQQQYGVNQGGPQNTLGGSL